MLIVPPDARAQDLPRDTACCAVRLAAVLARVSSSHPLVAAAEARFSAARGARSTAGALPNPVVTYQTENGPWPGGSTSGGVVRETSLFATLPLEALFQRWPRVRRAGEELRVAEALMVSTRRQVILDATGAFYRLASAQASLRSTREIESRLQALVTYNQERVTAGAAPEGDLLRAQVELARASTNVVLEQVELARARAEFTPYLVPTGEGDSSLAAGPVVVEDSAIGGGALPPLAWFVDHARATRPELLAARARLAAARAEVGVQQTLTLRHVGVIFGTKRIGVDNTLIAGINLPLPLFDQNRGGRQRAAGEREAVEQELVWAERTAAAEVVAAYRAVQELGPQVERLRGTFLAKAEEGQRITLAAYEEGAATLLQVLDATRVLADARAIYYRALFTHRRGILELNVVAGLDPTETLPSPGMATSLRGIEGASHNQSPSHGDAR